MRNPFRRRQTRRVDSRLSRVPTKYDHLRSELSMLTGELERRGYNSDDSLTAAGTLVRHGQATYLRRLIMPWQIRAFGYYDLLGEIKYASQFYSRSLANLILFAAEMNDEGEIVPTENQEVKDAFERIKDPGGGGRAGLLAAYGRLMFIAGESLLFVSINPETGLEQWEMLSTEELRLLDGNYTRFMAPTLPAMTFKPAPDDGFLPVVGPGGDNQGPSGAGTAVAYRLHRPHPRFSQLADSTLAGALDICIAEGSLISTQRGPIPIEEVSLTDSVFTWRGGTLELHPVVRHCVRGEQLVYKVTAGRRTIRATEDHPVLRLRKDSPGKGHHARYDLEWTDVGDLDEGDYIVALDQLPDYGSPQYLSDGTPLTEDVAWLLGHIVGDGHVHKEGVNIAVFNEQRRPQVCAVMAETWGLRDHPHGGSARFYSRRLRDVLSDLGLRVYSHEKHVPAIVLSSPIAIKRAFLKGYEEADGHWTKERWQSLACTSERLARELWMLYIELGENVSNLHTEAARESVLFPAGHVSTNLKPIHRFQVYYGSIRRGAVNTLKTEASREMVGENFTLARVKHIEQDGIVPTYDLEIRGVHNYIADGVVVSNCEELVLLTQVVRARARSRMATAGILFIDEKITTRPDEPTPDEDPLEDPFLEDLTEALTAPISDEGTAAAVVPLIARVKVPEGMKMADLVYHLQIVDPLQIYPETGLRMECIKRLSIVLDMPPEVLLGTATINHWGAWSVDEQSWKVHLQPVAQGLVEDLTSAYLQPYLKEQGVADWGKFYIGYDASKVINHPDRSKDAKDLFDRVAIGGEALRNATGFGEEDAPTEAERAERIGILTRDSSLAWDGIPSVKAGGLEPTPGQIVSPQPDGTSGTSEGASTGAEVVEGPPPGGPPSPGDESVTGSLAAAQVEGVAQAALIRAREAAGSKLRTACRRDDEALALIDGRSNRDVASLLGRTRVRSLLGSAKEDELVGGAREMIVETLRVFGVEDPEVGALIAETIERHAARTLYQAKIVPLPPSFPGFVQGLLVHGRNGTSEA